MVNATILSFLRSLYALLLTGAPPLSGHVEGGVVVVEDTCGEQRGNLQTWRGAASEVGVAVVGGGVAGLAAVRTLLDHNLTDLVLLEAQDHLGGRVSTFRHGDVLVEDGAEWIHGDRRNLVHRLASSLKALDNPLPDHAWDWRVVTERGEEVDEALYDLTEALMEEADENGILTTYYNTSYGRFYIDRLEAAGVRGELGGALRHFAEQMVNYEEGTDSWEDIAARDADQFVDQGLNYQWSHGYDTLIHHLKEGIPDSLVRLSSPVCKISWDDAANDNATNDDAANDNAANDSRVLVVTAGGDAFLARHVLFTASVAALQHQHPHVFHPPLPPALITTLAGVKLGVANKVHIGWQDPWWGEKALELNIFWTNFDLPPHMWWLRGVVSVRSVHRQRAVLQMFVTGERSTYMEGLPEHQVKEHVLFLLRRVSGQHVPEPSFFRRTRWGSNPWTRGSYSSFVTVAGDKAGLHRRSQLAAPLYNSRGNLVVAWAGEYTHNTRYGTVDGAMQSGRGAARRLVNLLRPGKVGGVRPPPL